MNTEAMQHRLILSLRCLPSGGVQWLLAATMLLWVGVRLPAAETKAPAGSSQAEYILQPMDLIKVQVFQEPDLERQVRISQESTISLPLINQINLKGKTVQQAQEIIRDMYNHDFLVDPQINLIVLEYAKHDVKVLGQVTKAGAVEIPNDRPLKLLDAIALAGGYTRLADRKRVTLTRVNEDRTTTTTEINTDNIIQSRNAADTWILREGDIINVPERLL